MKKDFVRLLIERKLVIIIVCFMVLIGGVISYLQMPKQQYPEVVMPVAAVTVIYPGAMPEDVEELAAKPIEELAMSLNGFNSCTTQVYENACAIMVMLDMDLSQAEVDDSFDDLRQKIADIKASLPSGVQQITVDTDIMQAANLLLAVSSDSVSGDDLAQRAEELKDKLKLLDGVERAQIVGEQVSEIAITVDADKLNGLDISLSELTAIIGAQNSLIPTGSLTVNDNKISVFSNGKFADLAEISGLIIGADQNSGILYRLSDIAEVRLRVPEDTPRYFYNGQPANVIALYFADGINVLDMGEVIRQTEADFSSQLPDNISVKEIYFQLDMVNEAINNFMLNLLEAILLVLLIIMLGMGLRNGLVVSIAIPMAIFANFIIMPHFNLNIQLVSLASLVVVLGMLVDNSVVVSEAIQTHLDAGADKMTAAVQGTHDVAKAVFVSMLTTVAGFSALLTLTGTYRQLAFSMPVVVITCLVLSFAISLLVTPLMCYLFLKPSNQNKAKLLQKLLNAYESIFQKVFKHKKAMWLGLLLFILLCGATLAALDFQIVAKTNKDVVTVELNGNLENDLPATLAVVQQMEKVIAEQPEVLYYLSSVGAGIPRYDYSVQPKGQSSNLGDFFIRIDLKQGGRFKKTGDFVEYLQQQLEEQVAGGRIIVDELGVMSLICKPVEIKLYSEDLTELNAAANLVVQAMHEVEGTKCVINSNDLATYSFYVDMDAKSLNSLGLTKAEVQNELSIALLGRSVSLYRENEKEYNVVLDSEIASLTDLKNYQVKSSVSGQKYALQQFADVTLTPQLSSITRLDGQRGRAVGCYASTGYSNIMLQNQLEKKLSQLTFPDGVRIEKSGEKKDFMELFSSIVFAFIVSFMLIFFILLVQFNSLKKVMLLFISVPFGIMAGLAGLYVTGQKLSLFALVAMIVLLGCVLSNAIILLEYIDNELKQGSPIEEACRSAGSKRLRPILMSTSTTVLGLLPLAIGGDPQFVPMAVLLMFGMTISMVVNLVVLPILYYLVFRQTKSSVV